MKTTRKDIEMELAHLNGRLESRGVLPYQLQVYQAQVKSKRFLLEDNAGRSVGHWSTAAEMYSTMVAIGRTLDSIPPKQEG